MGMWEFGGICELLFKLPKVGVGAFIFAPKCGGGNIGLPVHPAGKGAGLEYLRAAWV